MKYLKKYNESITFSDSILNIKEYIQYLKDIFQELVDRGYIVTISDWRDYVNSQDNIECIISKIFNNNKNVLDYFEISDVKDSILSAISYMRSEGFSDRFIVHWSRNGFDKVMRSDSDWEDTNEKCNKIILRFLSS